MAARRVHQPVESPATAERILREKLQALGWSVEEPQWRLRGDGRKVRIAACLRGERTMTSRWIADRLHKGAPGHIARLFYRKGEVEQERQNKLF